MHRHIKTTGYGLLGLGLLLAAGFNLWLIKKLDVFSSPPVFVLGILIENLLLVTVVYLAVLALRKPLQIIGSVLVSAWRGAIGNDNVRKLRQTAVMNWLSDRLNPKSPRGLVMTVGVIMAAGLLAEFLQLLIQVVLKTGITRIDQRVVNLVPSIRSGQQNGFFQMVTFLANWETALLLTLLAGIWLWIKRQRGAAWLFGLAFVLEEVSTFVIKHLVGRARPEQTLSLIREDTLSFPSGHVLRATVLFGLLAYFLIRAYKSHLAKIAVVLGYVVAISLVALSRIYLGVHYPSDVLASILFGGFLLTVLITGYEIWRRFYSREKQSTGRKALATIPVMLIVWSIGLSSFFIKLEPITATPNYQTLPAITASTIQALPIYSETLTGTRMEPISFIYLGSREQIEQLFSSHGWYKADPSTLANTLKAIGVALQNRQYLTAPVTPSYLNGKPQDLAFEQPTSGRTLRQRHHTRLWQTNYATPNGQLVWVATASLDEGVELASQGYLPTHHINPNVDAERDYIVRSLGLMGISYLRVVEPQLGKNASGDQFFTDGQAAIVNL